MQFLRQAEDQVERDVIDARPTERLNGDADPCRVVGPVHPFQDVVVERLGTEAHPVDSGRMPGSGVVWSHVFRVGFEGDFYRAWCVVRRAWEQRAEQLRDRFRGKQRRRAAAEVDGVEITQLCLSGFLEDDVDVFMSRNSLPYCDREVAVSAASNAEGDMQVK